MTPDNQEPTTTTNSDTLKSTVSTRQPTPKTNDNKQLTPTTKTNNRQPTVKKPTERKYNNNRLEATTPSPVLSTYNSPSESSTKRRCLLCHKLQTDNAIIFLSSIMQQYDKPIGPLCRQAMAYYVNR
jgi:hypothetical protein